MMELIDGIYLEHADITQIQTEAIVNAANSSLYGGGGVDGAIHKAGGPAIIRDCRQIRKTRFPKGLPPGEAVITGAGDLPARYVIHTVGPIWQNGTNKEAETLCNCYRSCLEIAAKEKIESIAFPGISTGIYAFPKDLAAPVSLKTCLEWKRMYTTPSTIILVVYSKEDIRYYTEALDSLRRV